MKHHPSAFDAVIFDIDNVLVDTRRSYLDTIRWTVEIFLTYGKVPFFCPGHKSRDPQLLSREDVDQFKLFGGFNDDWDCCYGLLVYLLNLRVKSRTLEALKRTINMKGLARKATQRPLRVSGVVKMFGVTGLVTIERIARIFQEVYLGKELFEPLEKQRATYWKKRGLLHLEKPIFRKSILEKLKQHGIGLGIATGRPRFEAQYALKNFGLLDCFEAITTIDDVKKAEVQLKQSLRKPHPYSVLETAKKMGPKKRFLYVGDLPDDILAAREARATLDIRAVGFPWFASNPKGALHEIEKAKPDFILKKPGDLLKIVLRGK